MKAIRYHQFGSVDLLRMEDAREPTLADKDILVRVVALSVNVVDNRARAGIMGPLVNKKFPKIPGADFAGVVEKTGPLATHFNTGDRVFGATNPFKGGCAAEFVAVPEDAAARIPDALTFEQAAALPIAGLAALYSLRELGKVSQGADVLIHGASGGVGLYAIQLAKLMGANVTAVCGTEAVALVQSMGADVVIDYRKAAIPADKKYDVVLNFSGALPFTKAKNYLRPAGRMIEPSPTIPTFIGSHIANLYRNQKHLMLQTLSRCRDLEYVSALAAEGKLKVTLAKTYDFAHAAQAFAEQEKGGVMGKIVISVLPNPTNR